MNEPFERLRLVREEAGYPDVVSAAKRFGWKKSTYTSHENGTRGIRPPVAADYARAFKVSFEWLLLGTGPKEMGVSLLSEKAQSIVKALDQMQPDSIDHLFNFIKTLPVHPDYLSAHQPSREDQEARMLGR